jgi:hypothetical protein
VYTFVYDTNVILNSAKPHLDNIQFNQSCIPQQKFHVCLLILSFLQENCFTISVNNRRWFKYDRDYLCVNKSQFVPVIFDPPCTYTGLTPLTKDDLGARHLNIARDLLLFPSQLSNLIERSLKTVLQFFFLIHSNILCAQRISNY